MKVVSFGGGVNSTALLIGLREFCGRPDAVLFADTGSEFPETYEFLARMSAWCESAFGLGITVVRRAYPRHQSLEHECHNLRTLPSKAFGFSGCSVKWKRQPMDKWLRTNAQAVACWERGEQVERLIGIDAGEAHRGKIQNDRRFLYRFPLIEWDWDREACLAAIARERLPVPRKSACFFCPATTKKEVIELHRKRPDLFARAVAIEEQAQGLNVVKGLGRHWTWSEVVAKQGVDLPETPSEYCVNCSDGISDE